MRRHLLICLTLLQLLAVRGFGQMDDNVFSPKIKTVQLFPYGNQFGYPILHLGGSDQLELHFDDLDANVQNYSYTFQLCNADWKAADLSQFDFIKGFSQIRISNYRISSTALVRYTHYQAMIPDRNCIPSRSGNYILKVFINSDTSKLILTRRMLVVQDNAAVSAQIQQPYNGQFFKSHQKIQFKVAVNESLNLLNPQQQIKVFILQNSRWDNCISGIKPTFYSRNTLEYNTENDAVFPAGKEWRWLNLRSLRLQSDRVAHADYSNTGTEIIVKPDADRSQQRFNFYRDNNGRFSIENSENLNPLWQADYANVHFTFVPPENRPFPDKEVFLIGQLNDYRSDPATKMQYNAEKGVYETALTLKQGYYDYMYITRDRDAKRTISFENTEGNLWETENDYMILVYYRALAGRADELIGLTRLNSMPGK